MSVLLALSLPGHIPEAILHINRALDLLEQPRRQVDVVRALADALNKIQSEWFSGHQRPEGEMAAFRQVLETALEPDQLKALASSEALARLASLEPMVMNHKALLDGGYRPNVPIAPELAESSIYDHKRLRKALDSYAATRQDTEVTRVARRTADLLYVVRSNIAHGEKTVYGPDTEKRARDEQVCKAVAPVQLLILDLLLDAPSTRLVTYGTLAPGESNHAIVKSISGSWQKIATTGFLKRNANGLSSLAWSPDAPEHELAVLESSELPLHWSRLEQFEGGHYRRRLLLGRRGDRILAAYAFTVSAEPHDA